MSEVKVGMSNAPAGRPGLVMAADAGAAAAGAGGAGRAGMGLADVEVNDVTGKRLKLTLIAIVPHVFWGDQWLLRWDILSYIALGVIKQEHGYQCVSVAGPHKQVAILHALIFFLAASRGPC